MISLPKREKYSTEEEYQETLERMIKAIEEHDRNTSVSEFNEENFLTEKEKFLRMLK